MNEWLTNKNLYIFPWLFPVEVMHKPLQLQQSFIFKVFSSLYPKIIFQSYIIYCKSIKDHTSKFFLHFSFLSISLPCYNLSLPLVLLFSLFHSLLLIPPLFSHTVFSLSHLSISLLSILSSFLSVSPLPQSSLHLIFLPSPFLSSPLVFCPSSLTSSLLPRSPLSFSLSLSSLSLLK